MYKLENSPPQVDSLGTWFSEVPCLCVHHESLPFLLTEEPWARVCDLVRGMV